MREVASQNGIKGILVSKFELLQKLVTALPPGGFS